MDESGSWKIPLIVGGVVLAALMIIGICISLTTSHVAQGPGMMSMQQKQMQMMDQAMQMAREAQQAQREHMRMMQTAMDEEYGDRAQITEGVDSVDR